MWECALSRGWRQRAKHKLQGRGVCPRHQYISSLKQHHPLSSLKPLSTLQAQRWLQLLFSCSCSVRPRLFLDPRPGLRATHPSRIGTTKLTNLASSPQGMSPALRCLLLRNSQRNPYQQYYIEQSTTLWWRCLSVNQLFLDSGEYSYNLRLNLLS